MKCQSCNVLVSQEEAHAADEIFKSGLTLCQPCARSLKQFDRRQEQEHTGEELLADFRGEND